MGHNSDNDKWILPKFELDLYVIIIYLGIKYESNKLIFSKDNERKPIFGTYGKYGTYKTYVCTDSGDTICPPICKWWGGNKENETKGKRIDRSKIEETNIPLPPPPPKKKNKKKNKQTTLFPLFIPLLLLFYRRLLDYCLRKCGDGNCVDPDQTC